MKIKPQSKKINKNKINKRATQLPSKKVTKESKWSWGNILTSAILFMSMIPGASPRKLRESGCKKSLTQRSTTQVNPTNQYTPFFKSKFVKNLPKRPWEVSKELLTLKLPPQTPVCSKYPPYNLNSKTTSSQKKHSAPKNAKQNKRDAEIAKLGNMVPNPYIAGSEKYDVYEKEFGKRVNPFKPGSKEYDAYNIEVHDEFSLRNALNHEEPMIAYIKIARMMVVSRVREPKWFSVIKEAVSRNTEWSDVARLMKAGAKEPEGFSVIKEGFARGAKFKEICRMVYAGAKKPKNFYLLRFAIEKGNFSSIPELINRGEDLSILTKGEVAAIVSLLVLSIGGYYGFRKFQKIRHQKNCKKEIISFKNQLLKLKKERSKLEKTEEKTTLINKKEQLKTESLRLVGKEMLKLQPSDQTANGYFEAFLNHTILDRKKKTSWLKKNGISEIQLMLSIQQIFAEDSITENELKILQMIAGEQKILREIQKKEQELNQI